MVKFDRRTSALRDVAMKMHASTALLALGAPLCAAAPAGDWPQFRGPFASGLAAGDEYPVRFDVASGERVAWRTQVPGLAHSSPIVIGERVFVSTAVRVAGESELSSLYGSPGYGAGESAADADAHRFQLWCLDLESGAVIWVRTVHAGAPRAKRHPKSSHANPTPAGDAECVVVSFGSEGLHCFDHDGQRRWSRDLGFLNSGAPGHPDKEGFQWGFASSPVIHDGRVFVQCDHEGPSFVAAFELADGSEVWRTPRAEDSTWSTPTIRPATGDLPAQLIVNGYKHIGGYDLATGAEAWRLVGGGDVPVPTPVVAGGLVFLTSSHGRDRPLRAVRIEARGEVSRDPAAESALAWELPSRGVYMQTPLVLDGLVYCASDAGVLACHDAATGEEIYRERVGDGKSGFSGSPVAAGGNLYLSGENGEVHVVRAGRTYERLAVNALGESLLATPALAQGTIVFRTRSHVVAIR